MSAEVKSMKEWALYYAELGLAVFPLAYRNKVPAIEGGCKAATTEKSKIERWWNQNPRYNIGIATGNKSNGLVVIDLDVDKNKGIDGYEVLRDWQLVYLKNDEAVCDSLQVAEKFGKEHKNVLQSIDNLIAENSAVKIMFKISSYKSGNGQSYRKFYMNRDGFSLLAMGFTGREALEWKLQYIRAFNQMENFIREKSTQMWVETRKAGKLTRKAETDTIQKLVEYAKGQGSSHAEMLYMTYSRLANKMAGINKRDEATVMQLNNLSLMENIILHEVDLGIMRGKHYQEIYRDCKKRLEAVKDLAYLEAV